MGARYACELVSKRLGGAPYERSLNRERDVRLGANAAVRRNIALETAWVVSAIEAYNAALRVLFVRDARRRRKLVKYMPVYASAPLVGTSMTTSDKGNEQHGWIYPNILSAARLPSTEAGM